MTPQGRLAVSLAAALVSATGPLSPSARAEEPAEEGFEYLLRVGKLNLDYSRFQVAADALEAACATAEGIENFECYRLWATAAEKAYRIGDALKAWDAAEAVAEQGNTLARDEAGRIRSVYGEVVLRTPWGSALPSLRVDLTYRGTLFDPELKRYVEFIASDLASQGLEREELYLPGGSYLIVSAGADPGAVEPHDKLEFTAVAGERIELLLPDVLVPYRSAGLARDGAVGRAVTGPGSLGVSFEGGALLTPGAAVGASGPTMGAHVRAGVRLGPVRVEARLRGGVVPIASNSGDALADRAGVAAYVLGQADFGLDLQAAEALVITPHVGVLGGTLGALLVGCVADADGVRWAGECRVPTAAGGVQGGVDVTALVGAVGAAARAEVRIGVRVDVLRAGTLVGSDDPIDPYTVKTVDVGGFTAVVPGGELGVTLRF